MATLREQVEKAVGNAGNTTNHPTGPRLFLRRANRWVDESFEPTHADLHPNDKWITDIDPEQSAKLAHENWFQTQRHLEDMEIGEWLNRSTPHQRPTDEIGDYLYNQKLSQAQDLAEAKLKETGYTRTESAGGRPGYWHLKGKHLPKRNVSIGK